MHNFQPFLAAKMAIFKLSSILKKNESTSGPLNGISKTTHHRGYLGKIWRNPKFHDCHLIIDILRNWLLSRY